MTLSSHNYTQAQYATYIAPNFLRLKCWPANYVRFYNTHKPCHLAGALYKDFSAMSSEYFGLQYTTWKLLGESLMCASPQSLKNTLTYIKICDKTKYKTNMLWGMNIPQISYISFIIILLKCLWERSPKISCIWKPLDVPFPFSRPALRITLNSSLARDWLLHSRTLFFSNEYMPSWLFLLFKVGPIVTGDDSWIVK